MNWSKTIFAVALIALMLAGTAGSLPYYVKAASGSGVVVLTETVSTNNVIYFYINLTYLRGTFGWIGTTVDILISNNGYSSLDGSITAVKGIYVGGTTEYIAGTIVVNETVVNELLNGSSGYLYLKFYDGNVAHIAASNRFYVVTDVSDVISANTYNLSMTGYNDTGFTSSNFLNLTMNLAGKVDTTFDLTNYNITITMFNNIPDNMTLFSHIYVGNTTVNLSDVLSLSSVTIEPQKLNVQGNLLDFALGGVNAQALIHGLWISYEAFNFSLEAWNGTIPFTNVIYVNESTTDNVVHPTGSIRNVTLNIGSLGKTLNIFPSTELAGFTEVAGNTTQINPGDQATLVLHNFPASEDITVCLFEAVSGKLVEIDTGATTDINGTATVTVTLPEAQYGGRPFYIVAKTTNARGLPATNSTVVSGPSLFHVMPYIDVAVVYNNGTFSEYNTETNLVPGDYLLVKGHGFLNETLEGYIYYNGTEDAELIFLADIEPLASSITVHENGTTLSILKIPVDVNISHAPLHLALKGSTSTNVGFSIVAFQYNLSGDYAKVFVNPFPMFVPLGNWSHLVAHIAQDPVYAFSADIPWVEQIWHDGGETNFTVEVMGVPFTNGSITMTHDNTTYWLILDNVTFNNGYFINLVDVPIAPFGGYYVVAENDTLSYSGFEKEVFIHETARAIDPVELTFNHTVVWTTQVYLGEPENITVSGFGWPASASLTVTIEDENGHSATLDPITTAADGSFWNVTVAISDFLATYGEGNYTLTISYNASVSEEIHIYYAVTPPVKAEVYSGTLKLTYPGDTVDVYGIVYLGGKLLDNNTVRPYRILVKVTVYYHDGSTLQKLVDNANMTYTGEPGIWHYRFNVPPTVKGDELLVKLYVEVQPKFFMRPQSDVAFTSLTVADSLQDLFNATMDDIAHANESIVNKLNSLFNDLNMTLTMINGKLVLMSETLNNTYVDVNYLIYLANQLNANLTLIYNDLQSLNDTIENSTEDILVGIGSLYLALTDFANASLHNQEIIIGKLDVTLDAINATIEEINGSTLALLTAIGIVWANLSTLVEDLNATITDLVTTNAGYLAAVVTTNAGYILANISDVRSLIINDVDVKLDNILSDLAQLSNNLAYSYDQIMTALGIIQDNLTKLDTIIGMINETNNNLANLVVNESASILDAINALNSTMNSQFNVVHTEISKANLSLANLINNKADSLSSSINSLSNKLDSISNTLDNVNKTVSKKLPSQLDDLKKHMSATTGDVKGRVTTLSTLYTVVIIAVVIAMGLLLGRQMRLS